MKNKSKKSKPKVIKTNNKYKNIINDPIDSNLIKECNRAGISEINSEKNIEEELNIGEIFDVHCVANNKKQLAALDFSSYGINKLRKRNKTLINKIIDYCNYKGVQILHNNQKGGMYLKTVFFLPKNYKKALKLMGVLWYSNLSRNIIEYSYIVGHLLGYSNKDIKFFIKRNYYNDISSSDIKKYKEHLNKLNITIDDLQNEYNIVHLKSIKNI